MIPSSGISCCPCPKISHRMCPEGTVTSAHHWIPTAISSSHLVRAGTLWQAIPSTRTLVAGPVLATSNGGALPKLAERPVWKPREESLSSEEPSSDNCSPEAEQQSVGDIPTTRKGRDILTRSSIHLQVPSKVKV
jgi:hypothetical protein